MTDTKQDNSHRVQGKDCPPALAMFAFVWQSRPSKPGVDGVPKPPKYSLQLVWDAATNLEGIKAAIRAAAAKKWGADQKNWPAGLKNPLRIGNTARKNEITGQVDPAYKDKVFVTARSKDKPAVVDRAKQPIVNEMDFYSGCMCKVSLSFGAYEVEGGKGIAAYLGPIQKVADGPRLAGQRDPDEEFNDEGDAPASSSGAAPINDLF